MIFSMTAYGSSQVEQAGYRIGVEIRAVNSRYLDLVLRFPKNCLELEDQTRKRVSRLVRRGRVEVQVQFEPLRVQDRAPRINLALARCYWQQLRELERSLPGLDRPGLTHLLQMPNLFEAATDAASAVAADASTGEALPELFDQALSEAIDRFSAVRRLEGEALSRDLGERIAALRSDLDQVREARALMLPAYQERLRTRVRELLSQAGDLQVDQNRLLQELAFFAERSDINEEVVRIESHLEQLAGLLAAADSAEGRQLDFLAQELHREVNTIGAKANDLTIAQTVVRMKSEIGKLKEQIQNVE